MRAPRYRFPDEVRSTTRSIASRMIQQGTIARSPEELRTWISQAPDVRERLEEGGYGIDFTAEDLFPLLQVFVERAGGSAPDVDVARPWYGGRRLWAGVLLLILVILFVVLVVSRGALA
jgi:hypothetical protein